MKKISKSTILDMLKEAAEMGSDCDMPAVAIADMVFNNEIKFVQDQPDISTTKLT